MNTLTLRKSPMSEALSNVEIRKPSDPRVPQGDQTAPDGVQASEIRPQIDPPDDDPNDDDGEEIQLPSGWSKGALLNVRNQGGGQYCITLYPEEFDPRHPDRALMFPNSWTCQDFVSSWYSRETADPRAR